MRAGRYLNAPALRILKAPKPQLAVVHGLVMDRVQRIKEDKVVYKERCCRNSYGLVVRQEYNASYHQGEQVTKDPRDKKLWAEKQIDWFIKQVSDKNCLIRSSLLTRRRDKQSLSGTASSTNIS